MQKHLKSVFLALTVLAIVGGGCGNAGNELDKKKAELDKLKEKQEGIESQIKELEQEIAKLDTSAAASSAKPKLVALEKVTVGKFTHYIDLQGRVDAENIAWVTPRGMGGQVREIFVKRGDRVTKGQLLLRLDDVLQRQQIDQLQTQLDYAKDLYQRQQNLWKQNIGSEVQVLSAKNNVESLEKQMRTLQEQLEMTRVYAQISGIADEVNIKVGENFTGSPLAGIKIVNTSSLKVVADVPENYLGKVKQGTPVKISIPDIGKEINASVSVISQSIGASTRGFVVEIKIPYDAQLRPNQLANVSIQDYAVDKAVTVPVNIVQTDEQGKFVLVASYENGKMYARKRAVQLGEVYGNNVEIKSGLDENDTIISEGYQTLFEGQPIATEL
ncbi:MAG TPA: efflux RND transporter periplasmic adaptor subunit [Parasegetibacter sp.]